jgi:ribosomal protein S4
MVYPGYMLNPGDLFQVDPERVMHATGVEKDRKQIREGRRERRRTSKTVTDEKPEIEGDAAVEAVEPTDVPLDSRAALQELLETSKIVASTEEHASAKRKRALRSFTKLVRSTLSRTGSKASQRPPPVSATQELRLLMNELDIKVEDKPAQPSKDAKSSAGGNNTSENSSDLVEYPDAPPTPSHIDPSTGRLRPAVPLAETQTVRSYQRNQLMVALEEARDNPIDATKPYATPWRPRPFMSAFAFVPRYLEVHPSICSAVYLRHPVARPGLAETPTPFDSEILGLARNWYLRNR